MYMLNLKFFQWFYYLLNEIHNDVSYQSYPPPPLPIHAITSFSATTLPCKIETVVVFTPHWSNFRPYRLNTYPRLWRPNVWMARLLNFHTVSVVWCELNN